MSNNNVEFSKPPRKVPLFIRWYLQYGEFTTGWDWIELGLVAILLLCLYFWGTRGFIDRHRAGWEPMAEQATVESYQYRFHRGTPIGYQCFELDFVFQNQQGNRLEGKSFKNVLFSLRDDKSFQKGDRVSVESYKYLNDVCRVVGTRRYPSDWRLPGLAVALFILLWLLSWFAWRSLWFLRRGEMATARFVGSETVLGSRQDTYEFTVDGNTFTVLRTVLQPKNEPVLEDQIVFYNPSNPKRAKVLTDISTNLKIESRRMVFRKTDRHVLGSTFIGLLGPLFFVIFFLIVLAPYLPL